MLIAPLRSVITSQPFVTNVYHENPEIGHFHSTHLICHSRESAGVSDDVNKISLIFNCPSKQVSQLASVHNTRTAKWNSDTTDFIICTCHPTPNSLCLWFQKDKMSKCIQT